MLSNPQLDKIYRDIYQLINSSIDSDWCVAWLAAELQFDNSGTTYGRYKNSHIPVEVSEVLQFDTDNRAYELFNRIKGIMKKTDEKGFTRAVFKVSHEGKFDVSFEYETLEGYTWQRAKKTSAMLSVSTGISS